MLGCLLFPSVTVTVSSGRKRKCTRVIQDVLLLEERKSDLLLKLLSFLSLRNYKLLTSFDTVLIS